MEIRQTSSVFSAKDRERPGSPSHPNSCPLFHKERASQRCHRGMFPHAPAFSPFRGARRKEVGEGIACRFSAPGKPDR